MDGHTQARFSDTPPESPKSCMKGSRRLNFEDEASGTSSGSTESHKHHRSHGHRDESAKSSSKRSSKTVMIKSPGSGSTTTTTGTSTAPSHHHHHHHSKKVSTSTGTDTGSGGPTDVQFQFQLTQHYDNPPPPPNCTSNGTYEDERSHGPTSPADTPSAAAQDKGQQEGFSNAQPPHDPQLVEIASKFVNEIIEKAKQEVASRQKPAEATKRGSTSTTDRDFFGGRTPWYRRAHGVLSKWVTNICVRAQHAMRNST